MVDEKLLIKKDECRETPPYRPCVVIRVGRTISCVRTTTVIPPLPPLSFPPTKNRKNLVTSNEYLLLDYIGHSPG